MLERTPRISRRKQLLIFKAFARDDSAASAADQASVSRMCANRYYLRFREAIYRSQDRAPRLFGDIEIDQSFFGGGNRKKVRAALKRIQHLPHIDYLKKSKEIRDRHRKQVVGIFQREGLVYVRAIPDASARTLEAVIRLVVEQGSVIYSDEWRAYSRLSTDGYTHRTINHSLVHTTKAGVNINGIESFWSYAKRRLAKFHGLSASTFILHLKECEWRYNHRADVATALKALLENAGRETPR